ncbi:FMN-dependent NADH-azoreductase [Phenylobacterium koreense]|uniref:FMN dependent NADH:quinone oxidoreductase n=1 Tax=Phenylobacterium koreense TaxID=266125 RepID=A0ABV2ENE9_9CAUL
MRNVLVLNSGVSPDSVSRRLVGHAVAVVSTQYEVRLVRRDLAIRPPPHLTPETLAGVRGTPATPAERATRLLSDQFIAELRAADLILIGSPMYNFGLSTALRAWFDHVVRPGETFAYVDGVVRGLVAGKRAIVLESRGGRYMEEPARATDFHEPYIQQLLSFIGVTDVKIIRAEGVGYGAERRAAAIAAAMKEIDALKELAA